jgi:tetratricopeptide (TPR) repeat protein/glycosyltransferase involved in cell wall biosynthesis
MGRGSRRRPVDAAWTLVATWRGWLAVVSLWIGRLLGRDGPVVVLAVHAYPPRIGGSEIHTRVLAQGLREHGYRPVVLTRRDWGDPLTDGSIPVVSAWSVLRCCDAVFTYSGSRLTEEVGRRLVRMRPRPAWLHHPCAVDGRGRALIEGADRVVAFNRRDVELTADLCGDAAKVVQVVPAAPDSRRGQPGAFRQRRGVGADYILWAGAWLQAKGARNLSERFALLRRHHPDWPLKLVMFGGYGDEEYPIPHPDIVVVDRNAVDLPAALADCLFVAFNSPAHPVGYDANPLILLEALLHGKTFVAQAGTPFLSEIGHLGMVVTSDQEWLTAVETLYAEPGVRASLEWACRKAWLDWYNSARMLREFEAADRRGRGRAGVSEQQEGTEGAAIVDSGATAGRDVTLTGTYVAGRDLHIGEVHVHEAAKPWTVPAQLPRDIDDFTGREDALAEATALIGVGMATPLLAVFGKPGVGKTAFATRLAHRLSARFPDGQLYVNLRGAEAERLEPGAVLGEFLEAVGVPQAAVPASPEARERLYRGRLVGRRVLVVLDNAADEAQVRPLLPGDPRCAVVVTSRRPLHGLDGARLLHLDVFDEAHALELLASVAGAARVAAEPGPARSIVRLCGQLPLALRIAGARLAARRHWSLDRLATRLADERHRLDELQAGDREVRASFLLGYQGRSPLEQRAFRMLGLLTAPSFPGWVIGVLLGDPTVDGEDLAERLVEAQLVEPEGDDETTETRYRLHDLLRVFSRELVEAEESEQDRLAAVTRLVDAYLALASWADAGLGRADDPPEATGRRNPPVRVGQAHAEALRQTPLTWLRVEKASLVAAVAVAHASGLWRQAWSLSRALNTFFVWQAHCEDSLQVKEVALDATRRAGDRQAEALALLDFGGAFLNQNNWPDAIDRLDRSRALFHELADAAHEAEALLSLGVVYRDWARFDQAVACYREVLLMFQRLGDELMEAATYHNLGIALREQGQVGAAIECFDRCIPVFARHRDHIGRGRALHSRGVALRYLGRHEEADPLYQESLRLCRSVGELKWEAILLLGIGRLRRWQGRHEEALRCHEQALPLFLGLGDTHGEAQTYRSLGILARERDGLADSAAYLGRARQLVAVLGHERSEAQVVHASALTRAHAGDLDGAVADFRASLAAFRMLGDRPWQVRSLGRLGLALAARSQSAAAADAWREALRIQRELDLPGESRLRRWLDGLPAPDTPG